MCKHRFAQVNDVLVCAMCGLTVTHDRKVIFDRKLPNIKMKRKGKKK